MEEHGHWNAIFRKIGSKICIKYKKKIASQKISSFGRKFNRRHIENAKYQFCLNWLMFKVFEKRLVKKDMLRKIGQTEIKKKVRTYLWGNVNSLYVTQIKTTISHC